MAGSDEETVADNYMYVNKSQKVIISDLLFYIWNRLKSDPKDDIVDACVSFYANKDDYVRQEIEKFFACISKTCTQCRGEKEKKTRKDIDVIIKFMLDRDISLGLGALAPKITPCHLNVLILLIEASLFHIFAVYGSIRFCFGYDSSVGSCYHISRAHGPITRFGVHRGP